VRVLPDQRPPFQFSGNQYFSNFWSCVHLSDSLQQSVESFASYSGLGAVEPGAVFPAKWQFRESGKLILPAGTRKNSLLRNGAESS
jgi:hypothetical protein